MEKGRYLKLYKAKKARKNFTKKTIRLLFICITALIGIAYLVVWLTPVLSGKIEIRPTAMTIEQIESHGFPQACYLTVTDGFPVFAEASMEEENREKNLSYLAVPVVSRTTWKKWQLNRQNKEPLDASPFRLFAVFTGTEAGKFWPGSTSLQDMEKAWQQSGQAMTLTGETGKARHVFITKPMDSSPVKQRIDWNRVRYLKVNKQVNSLKRSIQLFCYALFWLTLSGLSLKCHIRDTSMADTADLGLTPLLDGDLPGDNDGSGSDAVDMDIDLDVD